MKDWFDKESAYAEAYRNGRISQNIWRYIPKKYLEGITDACSDSDGYWIYLDESHVAYDGGEECGIIHEYTIADLRAAIKTIRKGER